MVADSPHCMHVGALPRCARNGPHCCREWSNGSLDYLCAHRTPKATIPTQKQMYIEFTHDYWKPSTSTSLLEPVGCKTSSLTKRTRGDGVGYKTYSKPFVKPGMFKTNLKSRSFSCMRPTKLPRTGHNSPQWWQNIITADMRSNSEMADGATVRCGVGIVKGMHISCGAIWVLVLERWRRKTTRLPCQKILYLGYGGCVVTLPPCWAVMSQVCQTHHDLPSSTVRHQNAGNSTDGLSARPHT